MNFRNYIFLIILLITCSETINAAENDLSVERISRPIEVAYTAEYGCATLTDTYLSPLQYTGSNIALSYQRRQAVKFSPEKWITKTAFRLSFSDTENPNKNVNIYDLTFRADITLLRRWILPYGLSAGVGGGTALNVGCLYSTRNGNNPASAKVAWTINADAYLSWSKTLFSIPFVIRYQTNMPFIGTFFTPEYGQLYYEIYMGDNKNLMKLATPNRYFSFSNLFTTDIRLGATSIRIGYQNNILSTKVNHITTRNITNALVIGLSGEWLSLNPRERISDTTKIISATY